MDRCLGSNCRPGTVSSLPIPDRGDIRAARSIPAPSLSRSRHWQAQAMCLSEQQPKISLFSHYRYCARPLQSRKSLWCCVPLRLYRLVPVQYHPKEPQTAASRDRIHGPSKIPRPAVPFRLSATQYVPTTLMIQGPHNQMIAILVEFIFVSFCQG